MPKASLLAIFATALAIRMDVFPSTDRPQAIRAVRSLANDLLFVAKMDSPPADVRLLAVVGKFLLDVLQPHLVTVAETDKPGLVAQEIQWTPVPESAAEPTARQVNDVAKMVQGLSKEVLQAWGANALGRFCAEPKGYFYARNAPVWATKVPVYVSGKAHPLGSVAEPNQFGVLRGRLTFWYNSTTDANFNKNLLVHDGATMPGAGATPQHEAYMLPCSSCAERSGLMTMGLRHFTGDPLPNVFPWMKASEKEIYDHLLARFPKALTHTSRQVLVSEVLEHRKAVLDKKAIPDFEKLIRDKARRMAIVL